MFWVCSTSTCRWRRSHLVQRRRISGPGVDPSAVRAKYGLNGGPWLLTVARLEWHKGIDTVMRALPKIRAEHPETRYAVAGVGDRLLQLQQLQRDLGLGEMVRFLGAVPDEELPALYNAADLYVGVSRRHELLAEGFGISLVEASACGLAVVDGDSRRSRGSSGSGSGDQ